MIRNDGKLHRRRLGASGVSLLLAVGLVIAVASQASAQTRAAAGAAAPSAVASMTAGVGGQDTSNLDVYTQLDAAGSLIQQVYEPLTQPGPGGSVAPLLATSWKRTGPKTWVFQLRHNVRYSNGRLFTSKDVVWSFQQYLKGGTYAFLLAPATKATAVGTYAVRFTLTSPLNAFPAQMEAVFIGPARVNLKHKALGTGPYMVKSHNKGVSWTLVANPHYWRKGLPHIKTLNLRFIQDPNALGSAIRAGTVDFEDVPTIDQAHALSSSDVKVATVKTPDFYWIAMNGVNPPESQFKDQRVRQAVNLAIDRSELVKIALGGLGQPTGIPAASWPDGCNVAKVPGGKRNLAQAQALMKAAGVGSFSTTLVISPTTGAIAAPELAQVIQSNLKDIGITVNIVTNDIPTWVDHTFTKGDVSMSLNWFNGEGDPTQRLSVWNPIVFPALKDFLPNDPALDAQIAKANTLGRGKARAALTQQICKRVMTDAYLLPLTTKPDFVAYRSDRIVPVFPSIETEGDSFRYVDEFKPAH